MPNELIEELSRRQEYEQHTDWLTDLPGFDESLAGFADAWPELENSEKEQLLDDIAPLVGQIGWLLNFESNCPTDSTGLGEQQLAEGVGNALAEGNLFGRKIFDPITGAFSYGGRLIKRAGTNIATFIRGGAQSFLGFFMQTLLRVLKNVARKLNLLSWALSFGVGATLGPVPAVNYNTEITLTFGTQGSQP